MERSGNGSNGCQDIGVKVWSHQCQTEVSCIFRMLHNSLLLLGVFLRQTPTDFPLYNDCRPVLAELLGALPCCAPPPGRLPQRQLQVR
eukprot:scaffold85920_cov19-Prasinocladus_malaysianus.AAC.1